MQTGGNPMTKNILLVGVGGQGTILASKLLTIGLMEAGYDVKMSEIHGMSQRGGSVSSQIRFAPAGEKVHSPVIEEGSADLLISFEKMEALRWLSYLRPEGRVVVNNQEIPSMPVLQGKAVYPHDCLEVVKAKCGKVTVIDAAVIAAEIGSVRCENIVLLGATVKSMNLTAIDWEAIIRANVKPAFADLDAAAFKKGVSLCQEQE
jgi:indolepyruvate ferredoxin oxidoreductase beta subunit